MKLGVFSVALASASNIKKGEEVPGENGWEVRCRLELDHPPAFAYLTQKGDLYYTTFGVVGVDAVYRRVQILTKIWDSRNWCTQLRSEKDSSAGA